MPPTDGHHERTDSASVGDERTPVLDALKRALDAEDADAKHYHAREALQLLHFEDRDEAVRLVRKALDAEDADTTDFFIREVLELLHIENTVASATRTNPDERAK